MKTHPDAVGSDRLQKEFIELSDCYEEAKTHLAHAARELSPEGVGVQNHRLEFYRALHLIESLAMPYAFHAEENGSRLASARESAISELSAWKPDVVGLFIRADREYTLLKKEKPRGPYLKYALALNIRPVIYSVVSFHLTGQEIYARQSRQNLGAIMQRVQDRGCTSLQRFLAFMIEDLRKGAAVLDGADEMTRFP
jgi:hypothetical protein